jgi:hypothetical protein
MGFSTSAKSLFKGKHQRAASTSLENSGLPTVATEQCATRALG